MKRLTRRTILAAAPRTLAFAALPAWAAEQYGPGVTDTEIKIGNTCPTADRPRPTARSARSRPPTTR